MSKDFRDQMIKKLRKRVTDLELLASKEVTTYRLKHRMGTLIRENNENFVENRKLRAKLNRSIDPAYIVAVCKAITGETNE